MTEDNTAEPPAPLYASWTGRHDTSISDSNGAAIPGKGSNFFISHLLREVNVIYTDHMPLFILDDESMLRGGEHKRLDSLMQPSLAKEPWIP